MVLSAECSVLASGPLPDDELLTSRIFGSIDGLSELSCRIINRLTLQMSLFFM